MFDNLSEKLGGILDRLTRRGSLTEADVDAVMREVRRALLEADVSLDVVRSFTEKVREQAIGATVVKSVTPGQMVVKIVHDELIATLGSDGQTIDLNAVPPVAINWSCTIFTTIWPGVTDLMTSTPTACCLM